MEQRAISETVKKEQERQRKREGVGRMMIYDKGQDSRSQSQSHTPLLVCWLVGLTILNTVAFNWLTCRKIESQAEMGKGPVPRATRGFGLKVTVDEGR